MAKILDKISISINQLPEACSQKQILMGYVNDPSSTVNVVLTLDGGTYRAYIGYPSESALRAELKGSDDMVWNCRKIRTHDEVARLGDRLDNVTMRALFSSKLPERLFS